MGLASPHESFKSREFSLWSQKRHQRDQKWGRCDEGSRCDIVRTLVRGYVRRPRARNCEWLLEISRNLWQPSARSKETGTSSCQNLNELRNRFFHEALTKNVVWPTLWVWDPEPRTQLSHGWTCDVHNCELRRGCGILWESGMPQQNTNALSSKPRLGQFT